MDNSETLAILVTHRTTTNKAKNTAQKTEKMSNTDPINKLIYHFMKRKFKQ